MVIAMPPPPPRDSGINHKFIKLLGLGQAHRLKAVSRLTAAHFQLIPGFINIQISYKTIFLF